MLTSIRGLSAATLSAGFLLTAAPAFAETAAVDAPVDAEISAELIAASAALDAPVATAEQPILTTSLIKSEATEKAGAPIDVDSVNAMGGESGLSVSGNVALVTDYRFRGVSFSDGDPALQGGIDIGHSSGFYVGTWASTIIGGSDFGEMELDVYGGWSGEVSDGITFDIGLLYYIYPTGDTPGADTDYWEPYASVGFGLGPASATIGAAYAWKQDALGDTDSLYLYTDFEYGIPDTPITLTAHIGYTDGVFAAFNLEPTDVNPDDGEAFDWGVGVSWAVTDALSIGVNYVDTEDNIPAPFDEDFVDAGIFFTLGYSM